MTVIFPIRHRAIFLSSVISVFQCLSGFAAPPTLPPPLTHSNPAPSAPAPFNASPQSGPPQSQTPDPTSYDSPIPTLMAGEGDYILSAGDTLDLMVYKEPDLNMRSKIARDGRVQLPLLGEVAVAGKSVREAQEYIRKLYDADYLVNPQIYLNIAAYTQRSITVIGQVARPGNYELQGTDRIGIIEAIGMAGGFTRIADRKKVTVKRTEGKNTESIKVNTTKLDDSRGGSFIVLPGDIITVGESWY